MDSNDIDEAIEIIQDFIINDLMKDMYFTIRYGESTTSMKITNLSNVKHNGIDEAEFSDSLATRLFNYPDEFLFKLAEIIGDIQADIDEE